MTVFRRNRLHIAQQCFFTIGVVLGFGAMLASRSPAQTAAETAATTSTVAGVAANAKPPESFNLIPAQTVQNSPASTQASPHIVGSTNAVSVEANRRRLEARAGTDAARLLVRATPSQAQVWINNEPVGNTPLLLILAPGKYTMEMRGLRQEIAHQELALLPKEIREVVVKLEVRYPTRVVVSH